MGGILGLILTGAPIKIGGNMSYQTKPDSAFDYLPFKIWQQGRTFGVSGWTIDQNKPTGKAYYVSSTVAGSDANSGLDAANPLASIKTALGKADVDVVMVDGSGPAYTHLNSWWNAAPTRNISLIAYNGRAKVGAHRGGLTWALDTAGGNPNTYKTAYGTTSRVYDAASLDAQGDFSKLTLQANAADVEANPGSWYADGTSTWMRLVDSRAPDTSVRVMTAATTLNQYKGSGTPVLYCENIDFEGGFWLTSPAAGPFPTGYFNACTFKYSHGSGFNNDGATAYLWSCVASANPGDGFAHSAVAGRVAYVVEYNCTGRDNGSADGADNYNGSSIHSGSIVTRIMGDYYRTIGRTVHDIGNGKSWNMGTHAHHSLAIDPFMRPNFGAGNGTDAMTMWLDCCTSDNSDYDLEPGTGSTIYTRELVSGGNNQGGGTITAY